MARLKWRLLAGLIVITISGAVISTDAKTGHSGSVLAQLIGFTYSQSELQFDVMSNGCTTAADFLLEFDIEKQPPDIVPKVALADANEIIYVRLVRLKADTCRRRPTKQTIAFPLDELPKGKQIRLGNTFITTTKFKRE